MGLLTKAPQLQELQSCEQPKTEAKVFAKALTKYQASMQSFEKQTHQMLANSVPVYEVSMPEYAERVHHLRSNYTSDLAAQVHGPISEWLAQYQATMRSYKALVKMAGTFGKSEGAVRKAEAKKSKSDAKALDDTKRAKLQAALESKQRDFEAARDLYQHNVPQVQADFDALLRKRDDLRVQLFSMYSVAGNMLHNVASLSGGSMPVAGSGEPKTPDAPPMEPVRDSYYKI